MSDASTRIAHTRSAEQALRTPRVLLCVFGNFPTRPHGDIRAARAGSPPQASQSPSLTRNRRARGERGRSSRRERRLAVQSAAGAHVTTRVLSTAWTFRQPGAPLRVLLSGNWHRLPTAISHPLDPPTPQPSIRSAGITLGPFFCRAPRSAVRFCSAWCAPSGFWPGSDSASALCASHAATQRDKTARFVPGVPQGEQLWWQPDVLLAT